jgi:predicted nucleic acid-binding protein
VIVLDASAALAAVLPGPHAWSIQDRLLDVTRDNLSAYDAAYLALAAVAEGRLVTVG